MSNHPLLKDPDYISRITSYLYVNKKNITHLADTVIYYETKLSKTGHIIAVKAFLNAIRSMTSDLQETGDIIISRESWEALMNFPGISEYLDNNK
jgi:hypothetical protein